MQNLISQTFAVTAQKPTVSVDHIDNYYITEASGIMPSVNDSRWTLVPDGQQVPVPTASAPYLWHKYITYLTDGTALDPIVEFAGSLGQNGFDYDLVPSNSAIIKDTSDNLTPANVTCSLIKRNADGSAETQSTVPSGYSVVVYRDNTPSPYTLGANVSTSGITSVITFVLKYGSIEVERHDIRVIAEGAEGLTGRGIQSQDTRFKATATNSQPATPTNDTTWNTWSALSSAGYSQDTPYLWKCIRTVYRNGNGTTDTEYLVEGPTVWGQNGADAIFIDLDNEMDAIPCDSTGKVTSRTVLTSYARLYRGSAIINTDLTAPVAANCKLGSVTPTVTSQADGSYKLEWVFAVNTQLSVDRLTANVAIGYGGKSYAALFTANVVKSGSPGVSPAIYQLLLSQNEASFARNSSNQLTPASISIRCGYTKNYNGTIDKHVGSQASDLQNIDSKYNIFYRPIASNGNPGSWAWMKDLSSANFYLVIPNSTTNIAYEFVLSTASGTASIAESNIFDRETLPINKDGLNGAPGESALIIDLTNESDAFGTKADGKITASVSRETRASMFYGITPLTATYQSTKTYEDGTNCGNEVDVVIDSETGLVTVTMNNTNFVYNKAIFIDITGTASGYTDKPKTARFTIQPQAAGSDGKTPIIYQLMPSPSQLSFARNSDGTLNMANNVITGYVKKIEDEDTTILSSLSGYRIYYGYGNPTTPSNYISVGGTITVSASNAASYASLVLELWKMNGTTKQKRLDRETIPILKDGSRGGTGPDGTGIASITFHRMFTMSLDGEPLPTDSGWIASTSSSYPSESGLSETNRYLWQKKTTTYTKNDVATTYEVSLLAQFNSGLKENLLEDTSFFSEGQMEAWNVKNGTIGIGTVSGHNSFGLTPDFTVELSPMLRQIVHNGSTLKKLKANTWYTLSFYAAMQAKQNLFSGTDYNGNGNTDYAIFRESYREVWLGANQSMDVEVKAYCASSNVFLRYFAWSYDTGDSTNWKNTTKVDFTETSETTKTMRVTNTASYGRLFRMRGYVYLNGTFTINGQQVVSNPTVASPLLNNSTNNPNGYNTTTYRCYIKTINVNRGCRLSTYLYRADNGAAVQHSSSAPWYVDGKKYTAADQSANANLQSGTLVAFSNDGCVHWQLSPGTVRHTVTFKTPSSLSSSTEYAVLFRMNQYSHYGWVSMPKLEENTMATEWIEHTSDRFADDMQHIFVGDWVASTQGTTSTYYHFDNGVRHVVLAKESASSTKKVYFRMKQRTTAEGYCSTTQPYSDTNHWEKASNLRFIAAEFILADQALLKFAQTNRILVYNSAGNVAAGMGGAEGGSNDYPLWVGADYENRATAAFRVSLLGKLYATGAEISGKITATQGTIGGFTIGTDSIVSTGNAVLRIGNDNFKTQFGITESSKTVQMNGSEQGVVLMNYTFSYKENNRFTLRKTTTSYYNWTNFGAANVIDLDFHSGTHSGSASNNRYGFQYAMIGNGHVIMNGIVEGAAYDRVANWSAANQIQMVQMPLYSNRIVVSTTYDNDILILPDKYSMFSALGCGFIKSATSQYFTFRLDIINTGTKNVYVAGYNSLKVGTSSNYTQPYMNTNLPYMRYRNNSYSGEKDIYVRPKNILSLMLVYDNGTYYAFIINDPN